MRENCVIKTEHLSKEYRLGVIGTGTLRRDLQSWYAKRRGRDDPNSIIGRQTYEKGDMFLALDDVNIEIDRGEDGTYWLVIHSGSRNLGKQVCEYYQQLAVDIAEGKEDYIESSPELIARLKAEGRQKEIQKELDALRLRLNHKTAPDSLCHLEGQHLEDYLHDVKICQEFAVRNREFMTALIL